MGATGGDGTVNMRQESLKQAISEPSWECGVEADERKPADPSTQADRVSHRVVDPWWVWRWHASMPGMRAWVVASEGG